MGARGAAADTAEQATSEYAAADGGGAPRTALHAEEAPAAAGPGAASAREPARRRRRRIPPSLIVGLGLLAIVATSFWLATRLVFFVGADPTHGNAVAIYQGLPYEGPLGLRLYSLQATSGMTIEQVPPARRRTFTDHKLRSLDDAENLVNALESGTLEP
jgi:protein phosphatase